MKNIYFVGFMGTGKSAAAEEAAARLSRRCVDLDGLIEEREGRAISAIFADDGEQVFRALERALLTEVAAQDALVVACGGGIVIDQENIALMKETGVIVCLTARPAVIIARTAGYAHRPLLNVDDPAAKISALLTERASFYAQADVTIDTSELTISEVVDRVLPQIR